MRARTGKSTTAGMTLIEVMISTGLLFAVIAAAASLAMRASSTYEQGAARADVDQRAHRAIQLIVREFADAGRAGLTPEPLAPLGSATLDYRRADGFNGTVTFGPQMRIALEMENTELDNGLDDDGNGLVDERRVVRIENPGALDERRKVICHDVAEYLGGEEPNGVDDNGNGLIDERGLSFEVQGDVLTIRLTLEAMGEGGIRLERTVQTSVRVRN